MGSNSQNFSEKDKQNFFHYIESETGQELLEKFIDATLKTSSKTAIAALGILYADIEHGNYDEEFKHLSCIALQGITEDLVNTFLPLCELRSVGANGMTWMEDAATAKKNESLEPVSPYEVVQLNAEAIDKNPDLSREIKSPEDAFASVNELIRRGMFLPDYASSRTGSAGGWGLFFGVTRTSFRLKELLLKAKSISGQLKNDPAMESQEND